MQALGQLLPPDNSDTHETATAEQNEVTDALSAFGLAADGPLPKPEANETAWLWPDNVAHWNAWCSVQTQWRHASGGMGASHATGLDYAGVTAWLGANGYRHRRRGQRSMSAAMRAIQACERGALEGMAQMHRKKT